MSLGKHCIKKYQVLEKVWCGKWSLRCLGWLLPDTDNRFYRGKRFIFKKYLQL